MNIRMDLIEMDLNNWLIYWSYASRTERTKEMEKHKVSYS